MIKTMECPDCYGEGRVAGFICAQCEGEGEIEVKEMTNIKNMFRELLEGKDERQQVPVGTAPAHLVARIKEWEKAKKDLDHDMMIDKINMIKAFTDKFADREEEVEALKAKIWFEIEESLGLSHDEHLRLDRNTGLVSRMVEQNGTPTKKNAH